MLQPSSFHALHLHNVETAIVASAVYARLVPADARIRSRGHISLQCKLEPRRSWIELWLTNAIGNAIHQHLAFRVRCVLGERILDSGNYPGMLDG